MNDSCPPLRFTSQTSRPRRLSSPIARKTVSASFSGAIRLLKKTSLPALGSPSRARSTLFSSRTRSEALHVHAVERNDVDRAVRSMARHDVPQEGAQDDVVPTEQRIQPGQRLEAEQLPTAERSCRAPERSFCIRSRPRPGCRPASPVEVLSHPGDDVRDQRRGRVPLHEHDVGSGLLSREPTSQKGGEREPPGRTDDDLEIRPRRQLI